VTNAKQDAHVVMRNHAYSAHHPLDAPHRTACGSPTCGRDPWWCLRGGTGLPLRRRPAGAGRPAERSLNRHCRELRVRSWPAAAPVVLARVHSVENSERSDQDDECNHDEGSHPSPPCNISHARQRLTLAQDSAGTVGIGHLARPVTAVLEHTRGLGCGRASAPRNATNRSRPRRMISSGPTWANEPRGRAYA
jgi:hypothetical protein